MEKSDLGQSRGHRSLPPPKVAPWLVFPHGKNGKFHSFYNICDDADDHMISSNKFIPELSLKSFRQKNCHQGWLIVLSDDTDDPNYGDCFLWNPHTLDTIQLPSLLHNYELDDKYWNDTKDYLHSAKYWHADKYRLKDCILTSPPRTNTTSNSGNFDKDSIVYLLFDGGSNDVDFTDVLLFCHPGEREWRRHELNVSEKPEKMLYLKNKLLVMCDNHVYVEIELQGGSDNHDEETLAVGDEVSTSVERIIADSEPQSAGGGLVRTSEEYIVESFGEVFKIVKWIIRRGKYSNCVSRIQIWKLDFVAKVWENMKSLDDHVLFISYHTQLSCLTSDLGFPKGCVYYTQDEEISLYKYDLEDQSILLSLPFSDLPTPWFQPEWMMIAAPPRVDDKRRSADCILGMAEHMDKVLKVTENIASVTLDTEKDVIREARPGILASDELVWSVSNHLLHTLDYIHLRAVSKRYLAIMSLKRSSSVGINQTTYLSSWMVFSNYGTSVFSFVNPLHNNEKYLMNIAEIFKGFRICFSKGGWLLMSAGLQLFLHNPFTRSSIKLPDLPGDICGFLGFSFSCLPTSSDCTVFAFGKPSGKNVFCFFIKRGEEHWRYDSFDGIYSTSNNKLQRFHAGLKNPVFYEGAFYCLDLNGTLGVAKKESDIISWEILGMVPKPDCEFICDSYLVECDGKLLCVLTGHLGKWVRIFRLNEVVWVEVKNLRQHMLCISNTSCISAVAPARQMENKIYFSRLHEERILFYSLDTCTYHSIGSRHSAGDYRDSKEMLSGSWIEPNWSKSSDQFVDWLSF